MDASDINHTGVFTPDEDDPYCELCGGVMDYEDCNECGGSGYSYHDCREDCCCCLEPEDNVKCEQCNGEGGWWYCPDAADNEHIIALRERDMRQLEQEAKSQ
jgi:hypothetical protein